MQTRWMCEVDPFCRKVLRHHWPDVHLYEDVRDVKHPPYVDVLAGGFPCQPVSLAGKREAQADPRWLWPEFSRLVGELRPRYVLVENVPGLASKGLGDVLADLSAHGYDAEWQVVSAASVGAPHLRERIFLVAYPGGQRRQQVAGSARPNEAADGRGPQEDHEPASHGQGHGAGQVPGDVADADGSTWLWPGAAGEAVFRPETVERLGRCSRSTGVQHWSAEPDVGRVAHGVPSRLDQLRAYGNAVVPQAAEFVGQLIVTHAVANK